MTITLWDSLIIFIVAYLLLFLITRYLEKWIRAFRLPAWVVPKYERDTVLLYLSIDGRVTNIENIAPVKNMSQFNHIAIRMRLNWLGITLVSFLTNIKPLPEKLTGEIL